MWLSSGQRNCVSHMCLFLEYRPFYFPFIFFSILQNKHNNQTLNIKIGYLSPISVNSISYCPKAIRLIRRHARANGHPFFVYLLKSKMDSRFRGNDKYRSTYLNTMNNNPFIFLINSVLF